METVHKVLEDRTLPELSATQRLACQVWVKQELISQYLRGTVRRELAQRDGQPVISSLPGRQRDLMLNIRYTHDTHPEGVPLKHLAKVLGITSPTVSVMVESLVEQGLLVRTTSPLDRRIRLIRLSSWAEKLFRFSDKVIGSELLRLSRALPEGFLEDLLDNLEKVESLMTGE